MSRVSPARVVSSFLGSGAGGAAAGAESSPEARIVAAGSAGVAGTMCTGDGPNARHPHHAAAMAKRREREHFIGLRPKA